MGFIASIFGRAFGSEAPSGRIEREDDFVDITLPIAKQKWAKDGCLTVIARGTINNKTASFAVDLAPEWKSQTIEGEMARV